MMMTLEKEKIVTRSDMKVIKRDGRLVNFDADKIYSALLKASNNVTKMSPLIEAKLEAIADRVIAEIYERFQTNIKIYEIQNIVEHELSLKNTSIIGQNVILIVLKQLISTLLLINYSIRIKRLLMRMQTRIVMFLIHSVI